MNKTGILFPHQLFEENILTSNCETIYMVEEYLFFRQFKFHKQKIAFHRASMKFYESYLVAKNIKVIYIDAYNELADIRKLIPYLKGKKLNTFEYIDTTDCWLEKRIKEASIEHCMEAKKDPTHLFINSFEDITAYFSDKKKMFQTEFYKYQRQSRSILLDQHKKPIGGKFTFDEENRLKYPKGKTPPNVDF